MEPLPEVPLAHVIMWSNGSGQNEGLYTVKEASGIGASLVSKDIVVAFQCEDDAARYTTLLEAVMAVGGTPSVRTFRRNTVASFCQANGYILQLESKGSSLTPPDSSPPITDWEIHTKYSKVGCEFWAVEEWCGSPGGSVAAAAEDTAIPR